MSADASRALLRRWYDEMWPGGRPDLILELVGETYTRHESGNTRVVTAAAYREQVAALMQSIQIRDLHYSLFAEDDRVCAIGSWRLDEGEWDWVQAFRVCEGRLVETWLSGVATQGEGWLSSGAYARLDTVVAPI